MRNCTAKKRGLDIRIQRGSPSLTVTTKAYANFLAERPMTGIFTMKNQCGRLNWGVCISDFQILNMLKSIFLRQAKVFLDITWMIIILLLKTAIQMVDGCS